ncbi:hypothetical protein EXN66_Car016338 [Channa argus]|uniref:Uncharacterized protein n=2 Tax=Channa argus TaxID=215402 RepID=A0A6G1QDA4_CHAAH|nr:hypothetical protein EXN66_Car016338 [Channa argus]
MTAAGVAAIFTGGFAIPVIGVVGTTVSWLGFATNMGSKFANFLISKHTIKEAKKIENEIENLENGIQKLMVTLKNEGERREKEVGSCSDGPAEDYVTERILRALAKRAGLKLHKDVSLLVFLRCKISGKDRGLWLLKTSVVGLTKLLKFIIQVTAEKTGNALFSKLFPELATTMGAKTAAKAFGQIGRGAVGLVFAVPELITSYRNLDKCETKASKRLRQNAEAIQSTSEQLKTELKEIQKAFKRLADVLASLQKTKRSSSEKKVLLDFAMENCQEETVRQWIEENSESETFFKLVDVFHFLKEKIDEEEKENHSNNVDITLIARGESRDPMIPARCLRPLSTITDVVLPSPWNCVITADATVTMKPQSRKFYEYKDPKVPNEMMIPNIMVSPLQPEDGLWAQYKAFTNQNGKPGRNRIIIIILNQLNGKRISHSSDRIPFSVVTLALSLVLLFSRFTATVHLSLGDRSAGQKLDKDYLKEQYASRGLTYSLDMFKLLILKPWLG